LKRALITGVTGQDGSYLAEFLLGKQYDVYGMVRRTSSLGRSRIDHLTQDEQYRDRFHLIYGDLGDASSLAKNIRVIQPNEIYNLGAQSHVRVSFDIPEYTADSVFMGTVRLLEALRETGWEAKFYQASSSEMYGKVVETPQTGNDAVPSPQPVRRRESGRASHHGQLSGELRDVQLQWHPVQS
jgi:GDPmannose 4,6-dehydratase